jgi:hypothetical protein
MFTNLQINDTVYDSTLVEDVDGASVEGVGAVHRGDADAV